MTSRSAADSRIALLAAVFAAVLLTFPVAPAPIGPAEASAQTASLKPSRPGLLRQSYGAKEHGYAYLENEAQMYDFVAKGYLVPMPGNEHYVIASWVRPYARPEVKVFIERLSAQYEAACGKNLVVTSLVRPKENQPRRSDPLSVHPTGMAIDLRVSRSAKCRRWLERALVNLEGRGVVEAARERYPPHYHVVLFPRRYAEYVEEKTGRSLRTTEAVRQAALIVPDDAPPLPPGAAPAQSETPAEPVRIARARGVAPGEPVLVARPDVSGLTSPPLELPETAPSFDAEASAEETGVAVASAETDAAPEPRTYEVRSGDNLWTIARRHDTSVAALRRANDIRSASLKPGQTLTIPANASSSAEKATPEKRERAAQTETASETYEVRSGDSLWTIARRFGTSIAAVKRANDIRGSSLRPGQTLTIPSSNGSSGATKTYKVRSGDSLWTIARRHGTSVKAIRDANGLGSSSRLKPGQVLRIPT